MKAEALGRTGVRVASPGFGLMGLSEFYGAPAPEADGIATLNASLDIGCTFWDTADMYGSGANERLASKVLKDRRKDVFLCTKFALKRGPNGEWLGLSGDPAYVKEACSASLQRLGVSQIDLYYQHRVDPNTPIEETVKAMAELVAEGKVRFLGLSECSAETLRRAHKVHPIAALQVEYSPWTLDIERNGILDACKELGVSVVAYSPLGRGFLTGRYTKPEDFEEGDFRRNGFPRTMGDAFEKNMRLVERIKALAAKKGCTPAQYVLRWVMHQTERTGVAFIPIPGTKSTKYLKENCAAAEVVFGEGDERDMRAAIAEVPVEGERYAPAFLAMCSL